MWYSSGQWDLIGSLLRSFRTKKNLFFVKRGHIRRNLLFTASPYGCVRTWHLEPQRPFCFHAETLRENTSKLNGRMGEWTHRNLVISISGLLNEQILEFSTSSAPVLWACKFFSLFNALLIAYSVTCSQKPAIKWTQWLYQRVNREHLLNTDTKCSKLPGLYHWKWKCCFLT